MITNTFKINGTLLTAQPSNHKWIGRDDIGIDGNGRTIYPIYREYELSWDFLSPAEFNEIVGFYLTIGQTGTANIDLPEFPPVGSYQFRTYSGTILTEPTFGNFFENYYQDVRLLIRKIRTA